MKKRIFNVNDFIRVAQEKFGTKFDYSKFVYVNAKTKSIIGCPIHGDVEQSSDKHLQSNHGCPRCGEANKGSNKPRVKPCKDVRVFLDAFTKRHGDELEIELVDYVGYTKGTVKATCKKHGTVTTGTPRELMARTYCCLDCASLGAAASRTKSYDSFVNEVTVKHKGIYTYPESNRDTFVNRKSMVIVHCPSHGDFSKRAIKHLSGQGCPGCAKENTRLLLKGGYNDSFFVSNPEMQYVSAMVYYVKIGNMYKIGITTNLKRRMSALRSLSKKDVELVDSYETTLFDAYKIEQNILTKYDSARVYNNWSTELFSYDIISSNINNEV